MRAKSDGSGGTVSGERVSGTRAKSIALVAVLQLIVASVRAQSPGIDSLFPAQPVGHVNDFASVIDAGSSAAMEDLLARLRNATGAEVAVVTLPDIKDYSPNDVGVAIIRRWGIGAKADVGDAKRNAGLVVLLVPKRDGRGQLREDLRRGGPGARGCDHRCRVGARE